MDINTADTATDTMAASYYVSVGKTARLTTVTESPMVTGDYYTPDEIYAAELRDSSDGTGTVTVYSGRAMAAARLSLRGKAWSEDDRVECAGAIAAHVMASRYERRATMTGTPQEVSRYIEWVWAHPLLARRSEIAIPYADATMTRLMGLASNWRRGEERRRATEHRAHSERVTLTGMVTAQTSQDETYDAIEHRAANVHRDRAASALRSELKSIRALPNRAARVSAYVDVVMAATDAVQAADTDVHHVKARDLLASLGLPRMGRAYVAAYTASAMPGAENRGVSNEERAATAHDVAETLGHNPVSLRKALQRSRLAIPSAETHDYMAHADIMGVTAETDAPHHGATAQVSDWREHDRDDACTCKDAPLDCPTHPTSTEIDEWYLMPSTRLAAWTDSLPASTRDRLAEASKLRDDRAAKL